MPQPVIDFLTAQDIWVSEQVAKAAGTDSYWQHVQMLQIQYDGLVDGYNAFARCVCVFVLLCCMMLMLCACAVRGRR